MNDEKNDLYVESCNQCISDNGECILINHIDDKDVRKHIILQYEDIEYPCIVCVADTYCKDERVSICSISDAKANIKYGYRNWW